MNGPEFVERIDMLLKLRNLKRQTLADAFNFDLSTITQWKTKNRLPDVKLAFNIATYLNVSLSWLLSGNLSTQWIEENDCSLSPYKIMDRIDRTIMNKTGNNERVFDENFYKIILDLISLNEIISLKNNYLEPDLVKIYRISKRLDVQFQWVLNGNDPRLPKIDQHFISLTEKYLNHIIAFDCLPADEQQIIDKITQRLFILTRDK